MAQVRVATPGELTYLSGREHLPTGELEAIVQRGRILVAQDRGGDAPVGWLRWGLFWDEIPFMNMLFVEEAHRRGGIGRQLVSHWESASHRAGHAMVMTSTLADEAAQHFYRRLGYRDAGCLLLPEEALEILFTKELR